MTVPPWRAAVPVLVLMSCFFLLAKTARGQDYDPGNTADGADVSVRERPRPEYEPLGVTIGSFRLYPQLSTFLFASDNVFAEDDGARSDTALGAELSAALSSLWSSHALSFNFAADSLAYADFDELDRVNWRVGADGRLDVTRNFEANGALSYADQHEEFRNSELSAILAEPVPYTVAAANMGLRNQFNRLGVSVGASINDYSYENVALAAGGVLDQSDRDRVVSELSSRLDYSISPRSAIFVSLARNWRDYDRRPPDPSVTVDRNSSGVRALVGSRFDFTRLVHGEIGVGYLTQEYDAPGVDDTSGLAVQSSIEWLPDPLITVSLGAERGVRDANVVGAPAYIGNEVSLAVDYEFRRNVILGLALQGGLNDYRGVDREDDYVRIGASADYLINRSVSAFASVSRDRVTSNDPLGREYDLDRFTAGLRLRR